MTTWRRTRWSPIKAKPMRVFDPTTGKWTVHPIRKCACGYKTYEADGVCVACKVDALVEQELRAESQQIPSSIPEKYSIIPLSRQHLRLEKERGIHGQG